MPTKSESQIRKRREHCALEVDTYLHPKSDSDPYDAAVAQGWILALTWVLGDEYDYGRGDEVRDLIDGADDGT